MIKSTIEKEQALIEKIQKARKDIMRLKDKRKRELGALAMKAGLADIENKRLLSEFEKLAVEFAK